MSGRDPGTSLYEVGAAVEWCRSSRRAGPHQDGNPKGSGRCSPPCEVHDDAHHDRRSSRCVAVHCGAGRHSRIVAFEFSREAGSDDQSEHEQATSPASRSSCPHAPTPATFRIPGGVPEHFYLTWDQFLAKRVIKSAAQDEELAGKQHRRIMTQTSHSPLNQCSTDGRDNDRLHFEQQPFLSERSKM